MIIDAILEIIFGLIGLIIDLVTALVPPVPTWFVDAINALGTVTSYLWLMDAWLPVGLILSIATAVFASWATAIVIGGVRWIVSYFFGGGGAT